MEAAKDLHQFFLLRLVLKRPPSVARKHNLFARIVAMGRSTFIRTAVLDRLSSTWSPVGTRISRTQASWNLLKTSISDPRGPGNTLRFGFSFDVWLGILMSAVAALTLLRPRLWLLVGGAAALVWLAAFFFILERTQPLAQIAYSEFQSNRLPLISFNGIVPQGRSAAGGSLFAIYGANFGSAQARVRVFLGERQARVVAHGANVVNIEVNAVPAPVTIEVNGCRGNSYLLR